VWSWSSKNDADIRKREGAYLTRAGWVVAEASGSQDGVALAGKLRPDVIVCSRQLPGLDGLDVIKLLAADPATATIPVLHVSDVGEVDDVVRGIQAWRS
jgi:DNA-binding response OmpR family regulator